MHMKWMNVTACLLAVVVTEASVFGQEDAESGQLKRRRLTPGFLQERLRSGGEDEAQAAESPQPSAYWIGARFAPLAEFDELVRAQLKLEQGLVVVKVVPEGPAEKAGLQRHDVLLKFAGHKVTEIEALVAAINEHHDAQVDVVVLRGGKQRQLKVAPAQRPEQIAEAAEIPELEELRERWDAIGKRIRERHGEGRDFMFQLDTKDAGKKGITFLEIAPRGLFKGIVGGVLSLPKDLKINIEKKGGKPAKIHVKTDDGEWQVTEGELDQLPADVRGHVEAFWGARGELDWRDGWGEKTQRILKDVGVHGIEVDAIHDRVRNLLDAVEGELPQTADGEVSPAAEGVEALQLEIEKLRRELRELKQDPSAKSDK